MHLECLKREYKTDLKCDRKKKGSVDKPRKRRVHEVATGYKPHPYSKNMKEITSYQRVVPTTRKVNLINSLISQISLLNEVKLFIQSR